MSFTLQPLGLCGETLEDGVDDTGNEKFVHLFALIKLITKDTIHQNPLRSNLIQFIRRKETLKIYKHCNHTNRLEVTHYTHVTAGVINPVPWETQSSLDFESSCL